MNALKKLILCVLFSVSFPQLGYADGSSSGVTIQSIQFEGLHHIKRGTALSYLKFKAGQKVTSAKMTQATRRLYQTGFFKNVDLKLDGHTLHAAVEEQPVVADIQFEGNEELTKDALNKALDTAGLKAGRMHNPAVLYTIENALKAQYASKGYYESKITSKVTTLPRGRIAINLHIVEGKASRLKSLDISGNKAYSESKLRDQFEMTTTRPWSFLTRGDVYTKLKFEMDLDQLRNFYYNHGYLEFQILEKHVGLDQKTGDVKIMIKVFEGPIYTVRRATLDVKKGQKLPKPMLKALKASMHVTIGDTFSKVDLVKVSQDLSDAISEKGYASVKVNMLPSIDEKSHQVDIVYMIVPGKRVVVRRVRFKGNVETADFVLRRAMLQLEAAPFSASKIKESQRRLSNLGYVKDVKILPQPVPSRPEQIDLEVQLKEAATLHGALMVGYGNPDGLMYGITFSKDNFLGAGDKIDLSFNKSGYSKVYRLGFVEPYYTLSGISRSFSIFSQQTTPAEVNLVNYSTDRYGASMGFGFPMSLQDRMHTNLQYENVIIKPSGTSSSVVDHFITQHGTRFDELTATFGWSHNSLNRMMFPTSGNKQSLNLGISLPVGQRSLDYYTLNYAMRWFKPISTKGWGVEFKSNLGYGRGYGRTGSKLPFFKNYYAGGPDSVRGFVGNTLGPRDAQNHSVGGNVLTYASFGFIVPSPTSDSMRAVVFLDAGNVFEDQFRMNDLRYSAGVSLEWKAGFLPLTISLAKPLNSKPGDRTEFFQFNIALGT